MFKGLESLKTQDPAATLTPPVDQVVKTKAELAAEAAAAEAAAAAEKLALAEAVVAAERQAAERLALDEAALASGKIVVSQEDFGFLIASMPDSLKNVHALETKQNLAALIVAIETHGVSKALLSFANHDGTLAGAVPQIAALEAMTADLTPEQSAEIVQALKELDAKLDAGNESLLGPWQWFWTILALFGGIIFGLGLLAIFVAWNAAHGDYDKKEEDGDLKTSSERIASVIHYDTVVTYLHTILEFPSILTHLENMTLPKDQEEVTAFAGKLSTTLAPLAKIGIHVSRSGDITTSELESPASTNIEHVGYTSMSLKNIGTLAGEIKAIEGHLKSFSPEKIEKQEKDASKEEYKFVVQGGGMIGEAIHVAMTRITKVLHLVKTNCDTIEHFYAKA